MGVFEVFFGKRDREAVQPTVESPVVADEPTSSAQIYTERDNLGTRHDSENVAFAYWMGERMNAVRKDPFTMYTFDSGAAARAALLELPCIHETQDSLSLICTEPLIFGYYKIDNAYELVLCGDDLTKDLWSQAKQSAKQHGGRLKNELEPATKTAAPTAATVAKPEQVRFVREERQTDATGTAVYRIHTGPDQASAMEFLSRNPVAQSLLYIVVETPDGNYCRDNMGIYKED